MDPLLASLLETVEQFHQELDEMENSNEETDPQDEEEEQEDEANNPSTPSDTNDESEDAAADTEDIESSTASTNEVNGDDTEDADTSEREALAEKLMDQLSEQLGDVADAMSAADSAFGNGAGEAMLGETGFGESQGQWRDTLNKDQSLGILKFSWWRFVLFDIPLVVNFDLLWVELDLFWWLKCYWLVSLELVNTELLYYSYTTTTTTTLLLLLPYLYSHYVLYVCWGRPQHSIKTRVSKNIENANCRQRFGFWTNGPTFYDQNLFHCQVRGTPILSQDHAIQSRASRTST